MPQSIKINTILIAAACAALAACSSPDPVEYRGVASSSYLRPNPQDDDGHVPFRYTTTVDWHAYDRLIIDPVEVYRGPDNQFGDMSEDDKTALAQYMRSQFAQKLGQRFQLTDTATPQTLRLKLTLTGADTSTPVLSTFTRLDIGGGLYNGVQAVRGKEGMMTGSALYVVEIYDATSNRLLDASVVKQYPGAYNIGATFGSLAAAKTGIEKGADALAERMQ